eukprot:TRINITY_DN113317_c0_g1_i1.p1 TRINITY_DN113317_c0_g1~~TRINITY_DN113317_c0_g1_i1.p1  ORF type:complete len:375 (+),score=60.72 TRINITY_DN113317_c0_g1_i1:45-1127(+)
MAQRALTPRASYLASWSEQDAEELFQLAQQGSPSAVRLAKALLSRGVPPNVVLRRGLRFSTEELPFFTEHAPLHVASSAGNADVLATLLKAKADANLRTGMGLTPLHLAIRAPTQKSRRSICVLLLYYGADHTLRASNGLTAAEAAEVQHGLRSKIACLLRSPPSREFLQEEALESGSASSTSPSRRAPHGLGARELASFEARMRQDESKRASNADSYRLADCRAWTRRPAKGDVRSQELCGICLGAVDTGSAGAEEAADGSVLKDACKEATPRRKRGADDVWWLPCMPRPHAFHAACVRPWLQRSGACPTCRAPVLQPTPVQPRGGYVAQRASQLAAASSTRRSVSSHNLQTCQRASVS